MGINNKMIKLIEKYQNNKLPGTPARCVHYPTCSEYSKECYKKFNFFKASFLSFKRILFCTPLNKKFYDPVPLSKSEKLKEKELSLKAGEIKDLLTNEYNTLNVTLDDLIILIYENTFGKSFYKPKNIGDVNITKRVDIKNGYERLYVSDSLLLNEDTLINSFNEKEENIRLFYRKLNVINKLIQEKVISFDKKETLNKLREYMTSGITLPSHSDIYIKTHDINYIVNKKTSKS